jgi:hypothetical protein
MLRLVLYAVLLTLLARAMLRLWRGMSEGFSGRPVGNVPERGVQMVRDPVCGMFLLPERAVTLSVGREQIHFCSATCRDKYRASRA